MELGLELSENVYYGAGSTYAISNNHKVLLTQHEMHVCVWGGDCMFFSKRCLQGVHFSMEGNGLTSFLNQNIEEREPQCSV